jgi:hypothetical protein
VPKQAINKRRLSALFVAKVQPQARTFLVWDADQKGLALQVRPSGHTSYKCIYRYRSRVRWFNIGDARAIGLADARTRAAELMLAVVRDGKDPAAEKRIGLQSTTFGTLASRYLEEYAKRRNKSWQQADKLIRRYVLPVWGELDASAITRADTRAIVGKITGASLANQVLASASAIFTWATRQEILTSNPCRGVERSQTTSRERVLSDAEMPLFWQAMGEAGLPGGTASAATDWPTPQRSCQHATRAHRKQLVDPARCPRCSDWMAGYEERANPSRLAPGQGAEHHSGVGRWNRLRVWTRPGPWHGHARYL